MQTIKWGSNTRSAAQFAQFCPSIRRAVSFSRSSGRVRPGLRTQKGFADLSVRASLDVQQQATGSESPLEVYHLFFLGNPRVDARTVTFGLKKLFSARFYQERKGGGCPRKVLPHTPCMGVCDNYYVMCSLLSFFVVEYMVVLER